MKVGDKIRKRRIELGMTMEELGDAVGVQRSAINKYEKGWVDMKVGQLIELAKVLQVSPVSLLSDPEEPSRESVILSNGIEKMSCDQQKKLLDLAKVVFPDCFEEE